MEKQSEYVNEMSLLIKLNKIYIGYLDNLRKKKGTSKTAIIREALFKLWKDENSDTQNIKG